jgi:DNA gyrase/topoisomerase IV subunit B
MGNNYGSGKKSLKQVTIESAAEADRVFSMLNGR